MSVKNRLPKQMLRKNMNASRYEYANCLVSTNSPISPRIVPPAKSQSGSLRHFGSISSRSGCGEEAITISSERAQAQAQRRRLAVAWAASKFRGDRREHLPSSRDGSAAKREHTQ